MTITTLNCGAETGMMKGIHSPHCPFSTKKLGGVKVPHAVCQNDGLSGILVFSVTPQLWETTNGGLWF